MYSGKKTQKPLKGLIGIVWSLLQVFKMVPCLVTQSCLTLLDPMDYSPPDSSVHGILQTRILGWIAISSSRDLPNPGIKLSSPTLQADSLPSEPLGMSIKMEKKANHTHRHTYKSFLHPVNTFSLKWSLSPKSNCRNIKHPLSISKKQGMN